MKKSILVGLVMGLGGIALAGEPDHRASSEPIEARSFQKKTTFFGPLRLNTTWAETGVAATGIASSDFLHNSIAKPAPSGAYNHSPVPAAGPAPSTAPVASAGPPPMDSESVQESMSAASPTASSEPQSAPRRQSSSASSGSRSPKTASTPRPTRSTYSSSGKGVVTDSGKDIMVTDLVADPPPALFEVSVDAGYQSRYYHLGINRVLNAGFNTPVEDTDVFYGGVSAHWNGLGVGLKYVRGTTGIETSLSQGGNPIITEYEEIVANIHYTLAVLPDGWLNVTGGYRAIFLDEESFYNAGRFDDFYATLSNSVIPFFRPSVTYHYLDQDSPPGVNDNTLLPGVKRHDGQLLVAQIDGQLGLPKLTGLPIDFVYYVQAGFDDELNVQANDWDHDWTQVGVTLPIFIGKVTISPNWNYNERANDFGLALHEHFWGVNVRFDF